MKPFNVYEDAQRAETYAKLEFPGTYYLAYRDLPKIIGERVSGRKALDFGCGTGRSTRFLKALGFEAIGVDISAEMLAIAREMDPPGDYALNTASGFVEFADESFDLILSAFTFDNIPTRERKVQIFRNLRRVLQPDGKIVNLVSSPDIYLHEWTSFSTKDFPENQNARSGDPVKIIITATADPRPVVDIVWSDEAYRDVYAEAGLKVALMHKPLAREDEPYPWVNETRIAPWVIYALKKAAPRAI